MILASATAAVSGSCKPRASGDDPDDDPLPATIAA